MLVLTDLDRDRIQENLRADHFFWLDLNDPTPEEIKQTAELLHLHPVAVEDTIEFGQRPKIDVYDNHLLIVFYTARVSDDGDAIAQPIEVHIYLSGSFVVTVRRIPCTVLEELHHSLAEAPIRDEGYLIYRILDTLADAYDPVINAVEGRVDALEGQILLRARREQLPVIYRMRQEVRELLRIAASQRDHFAPTAEAIRSLPGLAQGTREYLRDVGDHLAQVTGELQRQNEDLNALTGTYFNANADRLNAVATRITIAGTVFVTWTVFAGFFGQNFGWMVRHIASKTSFFGLGLGLPLAVTALAGIVMYIKRDDLF
jgi:magnesium transporter